MTTHLQWAEPEPSHPQSPGDPLTGSAARARSPAADARGAAVPLAWRTAVPSLPTVGRSEELDTLGGHVASGLAVVLTGPPGIGKTHLARALMERLTAHGYDAVEILGGSSSAEVPLGPCAHLVPTLVGQVPVAGLIAISLDRLRRSAQDRPLVVLADDVDLLDDASAVFVAHLLGSPTPPRVAIVATCRQVKSLPAPLAPMLRQGLVEITEVGPLPSGAVSQLSTALAGARLEPHSEITVSEVTGGNPLWVIELVRSAIDQEALRAGRDGLVLDAEAALGGLDHLVTARLGRLEPRQHEAVELMAVGGAVPLRVLETLVGSSTLAALGSSGLVAYRGAANDPVAQLAHPLYRYCVQTALDPMTTRLRLRQLVDGTTPGGKVGSTTDVLRLALWHAELGDQFDPGQLGMAASEMHWGLLHLIRRSLAGEPLPGDVLEAGGGLGLETAEERASAASRLARIAWREDRTLANGLALARSLVISGQELAAEMVEVLDGLQPLAQTDQERAEVGLCHGRWLCWTVGDAEGAMAELRRVAATLDEPWRSTCTSTASGLGVQRGDIATSLAELSLVTLTDDVPPDAQISTRSPLAAALNLAGRLDEGLALADSSIELGLALGDDAVLSLFETLISRHWALLCLSRHEEAATGSEGIANLLSGNDNNEARALFAGLAARSRLNSGRPVTAAAELADAIRWHGGVSMLGFRSLLHTTHAWALAWSGRTELARAQVIEARRWHRPPRFFDAELELAEAMLAAMEGHRRHAAEQASQAEEAARQRGGWYFAFLAAYLAVRVAPTAERLGVLEDDAGHVDGPHAELAVRHGRALVAGDPKAFAEVASSAEAGGERLLAVEALQGAVVHLGPTEAKSTRARLEGRLARLSAECEGARSPLLAASISSATLTRREREIAVLAARGWSSAAIADELVVSVRTVESHLYRAFAKLGITSREELAERIEQR